MRIQLPELECQRSVSHSMDLHLPQEVIDLIIGHTDKATLASLRLVSKSCRIRATPLYFRRLYIMLSNKSVANIENLAQSPYSNYVEELQWADKELQYLINDDLHAFRGAFKERLAGLSNEAVLNWHRQYRTLFTNQEVLYYPIYVGSARQKFNVGHFANLKRFSIINSCESEPEQYPTALKEPEALQSAARWSTTRGCQAHRGNAYIMILRTLASQNKLTHLSVQTEGAKWERVFLSLTTPPSSIETELISLLGTLQHLDVNLCFWRGHTYNHLPTARCRLANLAEARNLETLKWKIHLHDVDRSGNLDRPLPNPKMVDWTPPSFTLRSELYPKLRRIELDFFRISDHKLLKCLTTLKSTLQSLILRNCIFYPSLANIFLELRREGVVPPVAIFEHSRDHLRQPDPEEPADFTEVAITQYLVWLGMKETLYLHAWDEQIQAYVDLAS